LLNKLVSNNLILLIILAAIWGSSFFVIKICLSSFTPTSIASLRLIIASIFLIILFYSYNKHPKLNLDLVIILSFIGITGNFLPFFLISWAEQYIPSSTAGLLMSVGPLITLLMSHILTSDDKFTWIKFFSIIIGFVGIIFILDISKLNFQNENYISTVAKIFVIIAAFGYMISNIAAYNKLKKLSPISITTFATLFGAIISLPFLTYDIVNYESKINIVALISIVYLGIFPTAIAFYMRYHIVKQSGPVFLSYVAYLIPAFALIMGLIFLSEQIMFSSVIGIILVFVGLFVGQKKSMSKISVKNV
tara:strand:+ start:241 stop:1158 length:918 start_codon:yes stop_codon:yes gene_type:complete